MLEFRTETFDHGGRPCVRMIAKCDGHERTVNTAILVNETVTPETMALYLGLLRTEFQAATKEKPAHSGGGSA